PGDRVVLWLPNQWRSPGFLFALWELGAVVVPFDQEMDPAAARPVVASAEPPVVIPRLGGRPARGRGAGVDWRGAGRAPGAGAPVADRGAERPGAPAGGEWKAPAEPLAAIFFTSGTTGSPKGCMITHANLCSQLDALCDNIPLDPGCRLASILPLSHLFELTC